MTIQDLHSKLVSKQLDSVYIFTGEEIGIMNIYIQQIAKVAGMQIHRADTFKEAYQVIKKQSAVRKSFVFVIRDDKEVLENEKIHDLIDRHDWTDIVVFSFISPDKRLKFYQRYKNTLTEFNRLESSNLRRYVKKELQTLTDDECIQLAELCECDYSRILLEADKVKHYKTVKNITESKALFDLIQDGTICTPPKDAIFDWCEAMMNCSKKAFDLYEQSLAVGEASLPLLTVLYNNLKQTLQVQTCISKNITQSTGLTEWQIKCAKKHTGVYTDEELKQYMQTIREAEMGIKTGMIEDAMTVPYVMVTMLGGY